jgi:hypothetical protein
MALVILIFSIDASFAVSIDDQLKKVSSVVFGGGAKLGLGTGAVVAAGLAMYAGRTGTAISAVAVAIGFFFFMEWLNSVSFLGTP